MAVKQKEDDSWDFSGAHRVIFFCNGYWCGQSPANIKTLLGMGYPGEKILWYRGGMQAWSSLGFNTVEGGNSKESYMINNMKIEISSTVELPFAVLMGGIFLHEGLFIYLNERVDWAMISLAVDKQINQFRHVFIKYQFHIS